MLFVSIIMPVYNVEKYVKAAIESVLNQTFQDFECIIINDGSTDNSLQICQSFKDRRIRVFTQINQGVSHARNTGIRCAKGELIAFIDSDDIWMPNFLYEHVTLLAKNPAVGLTYNWSMFIDQQGKHLKTYQLPEVNNISTGDVLCKTPIGNGSCVVVRRIALQQVKRGDSCFFDCGFTSGSEDYDCWLRIKTETDWIMAGIPLVLTQYRVNPEGQSRKIITHKQTIEEIIERTCIKFPSMKRYRNRALAYKYRYLLSLALVQRSRIWAMSLLMKSFWVYPRMICEQPMRSGYYLVLALMLCCFPTKVYYVIEKCCENVAGTIQRLRVKRGRSCFVTVI